MVKKLSIGSKKENAKQIDINLNRKHFIFGGVLLVLFVLLHTFIWSPYLVVEQKVLCFNGSEELIVDNMTSVCGVYLPYTMDKEETINWISEYINRNEFQNQINIS